MTSRSASEPAGRKRARAGDSEGREAAAPAAAVGGVEAASSLPLHLPAPSSTSSLLLSVCDASLSLEHDSGVIGRLSLPAASERQQQLLLDLKGRLYSGRFLRCPSVLLVSQRGAVCSVDAVLDRVCVVEEREDSRLHHQQQQLFSHGGDRDNEQQGTEADSDADGDDYDRDVNQEAREEVRERKADKRTKKRKKRAEAAGAEPRPLPKKQRAAAAATAGGQRSKSEGKRAKAR